MSLWTQHVEKWSDCARCGLCKTRKRVVLARGKLPADVLFVGEAPGHSEDVVGLPFVGPAGKLLDRIIARALPNGMTHALTNLVGCIPYEDENGSKKAAEPKDDSVKACAPRLQEIVRMAEPQLIVCVGKLATDWLDEKYKHCIKVSRSDGSKVPKIEIIHPAAILRANTAQKGLLIQRAVVALATACEEVLIPF